MFVLIVLALLIGNGSSFQVLPFHNTNFWRRSYDRLIEIMREPSTRSNKVSLFFSKRFEERELENVQNFVKEDVVEENLQLEPSISTKQLILKFNCQRIDPEEISELLFELGTSSVSVEVDTEIPDFVNEESNWNELIRIGSWETAIVRANVPKSFNYLQLLEILQSVYPKDQFADISIQDLEDRDWVLSVQQLWKPLKITNSLTIVFPWHKTKGEDTVATKHSLLLEGGAAFGTGDHPTTRLCCRWLERVLLSQPQLTVLDYGCGSGILGLASLLFGASSATGTDIDQDSLRSARENAQMNNLQMNLFKVDEVVDTACNQSKNSEELINSQKSMILNISKGSGDQANADEFPSIQLIERSQYDVIVANILAPILINLAPTLAQHTSPKGGRLGLSGILKKQANRVMERFQEFFDEVKIEEEEDDWVLIICKQRKLQSK